jgi:predicted Fe-Mo cluster-binding NifX family protein
MKIAIPDWQGRVSPVFDSATRALLVEAAEGGQVCREMASIPGDDALERARWLRRLGVGVLICGAISRHVETALAGAGIVVIPNTCGEVDDVLQAFLDGRLNEKAFMMPGTLRREPGGPGDSVPRL